MAVIGVQINKKNPEFTKCDFTFWMPQFKKYMLTDDNFRLLIYEFGYEIDLLDGKISSIPIDKILDKIGFPKNWRDIRDL